jgi:hypothetical protein
MNITEKVNAQLNEECYELYNKLNTLIDQNINLDIDYPEFAKKYYIMYSENIFIFDNQDKEYYNFYKTKRNLINDIEKLNQEIYNYKKYKLNTIFEWFNF